MELPEYWLTRPPHDVDDAARAAFDELWQRSLADGPRAVIEYSLPWPKWQFACHLSDSLGLAAHGSGEPDIAEFEPRRPSDLSEFGSQRAVYASSDALWAMFFAVVDRRRVDSVANASVRIETGGETSGPFYVFSVSRRALPQRPWRTGTLYFLPRDTFHQQPPLPFGPALVHFEQLASAEAVTPLARLTIEPADFPFLADIRGHDDDRLQEYAEAMMTGAAWPDP